MRWEEQIKDESGNGEIGINGTEEDERGNNEKKKRQKKAGMKSSKREEKRRVQGTKGGGKNWEDRRK